MQKPVMDDEMKEVFACYVESGFPLALCLQGSTIGHATVCVGKQKIDRTTTLTTENIGGKDFYIWNRSLSMFVVNDDNVPCYQKIDISNPTTYYGQPDWNDVVIDSFMVPLPSKVYRDAYNAIQCAKSIAKSIADDGMVIRTFLASCRSYRDYIARSGKLDTISKNILLNLEFPRFIWITELSCKTDFENNKVTGLILLDATDLSNDYHTAALLMINGKTSMAYDSNSQTFKVLTLPQPLELESYKNNIN